MRHLLAFLLAFSALFVSAHAKATPDPGIEAKVERLLARMTLQEKIGQLNFPSHGWPVEKQLQMARDGEIGSMLNVVSPRDVRAFTKAAAESRLKIPLLFAIDSIYAFRVTFPPPIAWAATWDPAQAEKAAYWIAKDTTTVGVNWTFAPMVDVSRDPRWGRVIEGAGEDPVLGAAFSAARVRGYRRGGLATSVKHYVGYGAPEGGRDYNGMQLSMSELHDRYLPPFTAAIEAGSETVMASFNTINGVPVTMHKGLIRDLLKDKLGFDGIVTSDFVAIGELVNHGVAEDRQVAARKALLAGIDLDMESNAYTRYLKDEVESGRVPMALIDDSVRRVLRVKFRMGLFDKPVADVDKLPLKLSLKQQRQAAREVARDGFVLVKNHGHYLPIAPTVQAIALIGKAADHTDHDHSWYGPAGYQKPAAQTLVAAMTERASARGQALAYAPAFADPCGQSFDDKDEALSIAAAADIVVFVVAEDCLQVGEGVSRTRLELSGVQQEMLEALVALSKPIVLVVETGRPLTLTYADRYAQAILVAWHPGTEGRTALAEVLFGEHAPSGKLPMTFPRAVGQIPIAHDGLPTSRPYTGDRYTTGYVDEQFTPLYPFGWGLGYTWYDYQAVKLSTDALDRDGTLGVEVTLTNMGDRDGREVVQIYTRQLVASRSRPMRQLKAFRKVALKARETKTVRFEIKASELGYHDDDGNLIVEPGPFELYAGGSAATDLTAKFKITGDAPLVLPVSKLHRAP
jgi:beta-glucosidase